MANSIDEVSIKGFKSIRSLENFPLRDVNILIGANGSGKSNFVTFFSFLHELVDERLQLAVNRAGGADIHLFLGPKVTRQVAVELRFGKNGYDFELEPTLDNRLVFKEERIRYTGQYRHVRPVYRSIGSGQTESKLKENARRGKNKNVANHVFQAIASWTVYHFHDTSDTAPMRRTCSVRDNVRLRADAGNLAAFLFRLKEEKPTTYEAVADTIRLVVPFFDEFLLRPKKANGDEFVQLEWTQRNTDYPFHPGQFSDGTLRFIALATALLQPDPPSTILIDEPELGLHPYALNVLTSLIRQARRRTQLIVSTQSAGLLNGFEPQDIVVIDRSAGASTFRRLSRKELTVWLEEEYSLGELWQKEVYGGGPVHE